VIEILKSIEVEIDVMLNQFFAYINAVENYENTPHAKHEHT
jgi:hypothetical protein